LLSQHEDWMDAAVDTIPTIDDYTKAWVKTLIHAGEAEADLERMTRKLVSPFEQIAKAGALPPITGGLKVFDDLVKKEEAARKAAEAHAKALQALVEQIGGTKAAKDVGDLVTAFHRLSPAQQENVQVIDRLLAAYEPLRKNLAPGALPQDFENLRAVHGKLHEEIVKLEGGTSDLAAALKLLPGGNALIIPSMRDLDGLFLKSATDVDGYRASIEQLQRSGPFMAAALVGVNKQIATLPNVVPQGTKAIQEATAAANTFADALTGNLSQSLAGMNDIFQRAFEGGGGVGGAVKSFATSVLSNALSLIPAVGPILSQFSGAFVAGFQKLFGGVSAEEKKGRDTVKAFEAQIASALTATQKAQAGGEAWKMTAIGVRDAFLATGHSAAEADAAVKRLWDSSKQSEEEQKAAQQAITDVMDLQKKAVEALPAILKEVSGGMNAISQGTIGALNTTAAAIDKTKAGSTEAFAKVRKDAETEFDRTGRLAVTAFNAALAGGKSFGEALTELGPTFDDLVLAQGTFGFTTSETLQQLLEFRTFAAGPGKEVMSTLEGVNAMMSGLSKMGLLTQQDFSDLSSIAVDTFNQMTAGGVNGRQAMAAMQPTLQKIWQLHKDQGLVIDDNTQALITQAEEAGIVGEQMREPQEQMLEVLKAIAKALGADLPESADKAAQRIKEAFDKIPKTVDVIVAGTWMPPEISVGAPAQNGESTAVPETFSRGGLVRALGAQRFAMGGLVPAIERLGFQSGGRVPFNFAPIGSDRVPALLTPGELVMTQPQQQQIAELLERGLQTAQTLTAGTGKEGAPIVINENFHVSLSVSSLDPRAVPDIVEDQLMPEFLRQVEDHRRDFTTRWQRALRKE
jgi:hypothetical protein